MSSPAVTVLMSAYNAEATVGRAIESILSQSFKNFEFLIINDGSSDGTLGIIESYAESDSRIRVIDQENMGVPVASNRGLREARGEFIARFDADDVSLPHRLGVQYELLSGNSDIVLTGGESINFYGGKEVSRVFWVDEDVIYAERLLDLHFAHSTMMYRRDVALSIGGYDDRYRHAEDVDLFVRFFSAGRVVMLQGVVLHRHLLDSGISFSQPSRIKHYRAFRSRLRHHPRSKKLGYILRILYKIVYRRLPLGFQGVLSRLEILVSRLKKAFRRRFSGKA